MYYPFKEISVYELREFIKKYKPKSLTLNIVQADQIYSKLDVFPSKPLQFNEFSTEEHPLEHPLSFEGLPVIIL